MKGFDHISLIKKQQQQKNIPYSIFVIILNQSTQSIKRFSSGKTTAQNCHLKKGLTPPLPQPPNSHVLYCHIQLALLLTFYVYGSSFF